MSGDVIRQNAYGVILNYGDPSVLRAYHTQRTAQPSDYERTAIIAAEHELIVLEIIAEHLDLSGIGMTRIMDAIWVIGEALDSKRPRLGMRR